MESLLAGLKKVIILIRSIYFFTRTAQIHRTALTDGFTTECKQTFVCISYYEGMMLFVLLIKLNYNMFNKFE